MEAGVSVIICTYNGAALLPETLRHLAMQKVPREIPWEIIIIDNASTDQTAAVAQTVWDSFESLTSFKILNQPKAGLTFAREMGLANARYEFVLFCDDDNWLCPGYVKRAYEIMLQHPEIGMLGGFGEMTFDGNAPAFVKNSRLFASGPQAASSGKVKRNVVYGAGSIMRRSAFDQLQQSGFRSKLTDRKGNSLSSGGDHELCYALAMLDYEIWFDEQLKFNHFIPAKRQTWEYHERYFRECAQSFSALIPYRFVVNKNCSSISQFHVHLCKTVAFYALKLFKNHYRQFIPSEPETSQTLILQQIALKAKLRNALNYQVLRRNFEEIRVLANSLRQSTTINNDPQPAPKGMHPHFLPNS